MKQKTQSFLLPLCHLDTSMPLSAPACTTPVQAALGGWRAQGAKGQSPPLLSLPMVQALPASVSSHVHLDEGLSHGWRQ